MNNLRRKETVNKCIKENFPVTTWTQPALHQNGILHLPLERAHGLLRDALLNHPNNAQGLKTSTLYSGINAQSGGGGAHDVDWMKEI